MRCFEVVSPPVPRPSPYPVHSPSRRQRYRFNVSTPPSSAHPAHSVEEEETSSYIPPTSPRSPSFIRYRPQGCSRQTLTAPLVGSIPFSSTLPPSSRSRDSEIVQVSLPVRLHPSTTSPGAVDTVANAWAHSWIAYSGVVLHGGRGMQRAHRKARAGQALGQGDYVDDNVLTSSLPYVSLWYRSSSSPPSRRLSLALVVPCPFTRSERVAVR